VLDQFGAERPHRAVLFDRVAVRHADRGPQAVTGRGKGETLAVIATRGGDDSRRVGLLALQAFHIDEPAAHLEGTDRRMVLVLDHHARAKPLGKQGPGVRRRRRHRLPHHLVCAFEVPEIKHLLASSVTVGSLSPLAGRGLG